MNNLVKVLVVSLFVAGCDQVTNKNSEQVAEPKKVEKCYVSDPDINSFYSGECKDGMANGKGVAKGRDTYEGEFKDGSPHGFGIYTWGASSEWAGDVYEGEWKNDTRTGAGQYTTLSGIINKGSYLRGKLHGFGELIYPKEETIGRNFRKDFFWENDMYVLRGYFIEDKFQFSCESVEDCHATWESKKKSKEIASKEKSRILKEEASRREVDEILKKISNEKKEYQECIDRKNHCRATCTDRCSYCKRIKC